MKVVPVLPPAPDTKKLAHDLSEAVEDWQWKQSNMI
jgi:hypothetical protein